MNADDIICAVEVAIILYLFFRYFVKITVIKDDPQEMLIKESNEFLRRK